MKVILSLDLKVPGYIYKNPATLHHMRYWQLRKWVSCQHLGQLNTVQEAFEETGNTGSQGTNAFTAQSKISPLEWAQAPDVR